ncbi:phage protein [Desulfatibacillum aliphaticivorans]|uniref:Phage protein n=1 Tax=Desulfatibacillum aliphaticivorans TaxID=218208 RepID=B8FKW9_DESAL|nr:hypothetical protein [Desulfatibacillum aliphaticivorans]ACL04491.1 phage protein [Desulfatibacillum aliphaticivorans]
MNNETGHSQKLSRKQEAAILGLLTLPTMAQAAESAGITSRTLLRWLKNEDFIEAYRQARREVVQQAVAGIQGAMSEALDTLRDVMKDAQATPAARVSAARTILDMGLKGVELEDVLVRLEALETQLNNSMERT